MFILYLIKKGVWFYKYVWFYMWVINSGILIFLIFKGNENWFENLDSLRN